MKNGSSSSTAKILHRVDDVDRKAWNDQRGLSKTEAKRRYISTLIDTMTRYATSTPEARELLAELSFVWDQIKSRSRQYSSSEEEKPLLPSRIRRISSRGEGLAVLEPRSEGTRDWEGAVFSDGEEEMSDTRSNSRRFRRQVNRAIEALRADIVALKEDMNIMRTRNRRLTQRDGILITLGKWTIRFVGVISCDRRLI